MLIVALSLLSRILTKHVIFRPHPSRTLRKPPASLTGSRSIGDVPKFSSICPVTGQPDSAHLEILYIPDATCVETKSLKFYLASYRNHASFNEAIVNRVLDDIVKACAPKQVVVRGEFGARGGIQLTCEARFPDLEETLRLPE
jgi:7-cyano-7-deazaguanine reductase